MLTSVLVKRRGSRVRQAWLRAVLAAVAATAIGLSKSGSVEASDLPAQFASPESLLPQSVEARTMGETEVRQGLEESYGRMRDRHEERIADREQEEPRDYDLVAPDPSSPDFPEYLHSLQPEKEPEQ